MALSLLCGGLGVAEAAVVHVNEVAGGTSAVYTTDETYTKTEADAKYAKATDVTANTTNIGTNKAAIEDLKDNKLDKTLASATFATKDALNNLTATVNDKADEAAVTTALDGKADKATTLAGYGITDAYTKGDVDDKLNAKADAANVFTKDQTYTRDQVNTKLADYAKSADVYTKTDADAKFATSGALTTAKTELDQKIDKEIQDRKNAIKDTNDRTGGIARNTEKTQTTIEGIVKVDNQGNVKDVKGLAAETITTTGDAAIGGTLGVTGATTLNGALTANGEATFKDKVSVEKDLTVNGKLNVGEIYLKNDKLESTGKKHDSATSITADGISNLAKVTEHGNTTESQFTHNEKGTFNHAKDGTTTDWKESTSNVTADGVANVAKDSKGNNNTFTQTSTDTKNILTDKDGNTSTTRQDGKGIYGYAKDKDGNKSYTKQEGNRIAESVIGKDGTETKSEMTSTDITNTAKDGTITNDAKDIVNNATGDMTNTVGGNLTTTVGGNENHEVKGTKTETVEGKVTENFKGGQETNVTGDQTTNVSGTQTTNATDINRNASSGMIDKVDNDYGTNTETKVAGKTITDVSIKGTGEKGQYIRGANESRDYLIKGTLKNSETKTVDATSTEITDGNGNISATIQDAKNLAGSVNNGTETGISGIHANDDGSVSIDSIVTDGSTSSVINQKKDSIQSAVGDGNSSTVIRQDKDNVTIASSNGTVAIGGKDIINNAQDTITNTAGTKITDTAGDSTVTTENGKGTTFSKTGSTAYREGGPTDTNISGNTITTGKVTMDYTEVMKDLGVRGNANIAGKTTTGELEVTGKSTLKGDVTMESNATVKKDLTVEGNTNLKNTKVDGTLDVTQKATFGDSVSIAKDLSVDGNATIKGDVTAKSYKVGDKTYISAAGINANDQKITNVADGSISEGSKDAVNGGQLYTVKNDLEGKVNKVGANAAAMANLHPMEFDPDSKWNIAAAIGNYGSETAAALGAFYRPNDDVMVNLSTAFGTGENMVGGGVSVRLGKGGNKLSREETNALKAQVADLTARMDALLSVLNPNMSKDFPDVPENHWAYEAVSRLAGNDIVQGYPDGEFHGERTMTRYEMAEIIYNALSRGAEAERKLVEEFKPELQAMAASEKSTAEKAEG